MTLRRIIAVSLLTVIAAIVVVLLIARPKEFVLGVLALYAVYSLIQSSVDFEWKTYSHRNRAALKASRFPADRKGSGHVSFSLIFPAYEEAGVLGATLENAASVDYRDYEMLVSLREGDDATIAEAQAVAARYPDKIRVFVNRFEATEKKSAQMNRVLPYVTGDYVTPVDAESLLSPRILRGFDAVLSRGNADGVQGPVQLTNLDPAARGNGLVRDIAAFIGNDWFGPHNVLEYRTTFEHKMMKQQDLGVMPLGGNTIPVRTDLIRAAGGWDDSCLTEDAELGMRLATRFGARIVAASGSEYATREHTPPRIFKKGTENGWFQQRIRWDQGFLQVLGRGEWLRLPTLKQRITGFYILATPFMQMVNAFMLLLAVPSAFFLKAPLPLTLLLFSPFIPLLLTMVTGLGELRAFSREFGITPAPRHYVSLVVGFLPYQLLLGLAAAAAIRRQVVGRTDWSRTARNPMVHGAQASLILTD